MRGMCISVIEFPLDIGLELPGGHAYYYYHTWTDLYRGVGSSGMSRQLEGKNT